MKHVKCISHVAIDVSDIDAALDFYVRKLGFEEMFRLDWQGWLIVNLRISDTQHLELFPVAEGAAAPAHNGAGAHHVCLEVDDIGAAIAELEARGVELFRPRTVAIDNNEQAWISDPDGNRIELMQMTSDSLHLRARARLARAAGEQVAATV